MAFYKLNRQFGGKKLFLLELSGFVVILLVWTLITWGEEPLVSKGILPSPARVFFAFGELLRNNGLVPNFFYSLGLNLGGYMEAIMISLPLAFILGLVPALRGAFQRPVDAVRFLVLPAAVGLFIAWFGIGSWMKIHFLAFGIIIYLLPIAIQRIDEVNEVYLKTVYTLGATPWQMIRTVYFPSVISKLFSDIRILTAISWTYIVIAESIGGEAGLGALTWQVGLRRGRIDKVFCLLIIIMLVGILQDKLFVYMDKKLFPHKYQGNVRHHHPASDTQSIGETIMDYTMSTLIGAFLVGYIVLSLDEYFGLLGHYDLLSFLFRDTLWVIHLLFVLIIWYQASKFIGNRRLRLINLNK